MYDLIEMCNQYGFLLQRCNEHQHIHTYGRLTHKNRHTVTRPYRAGDTTVREFYIAFLILSLILSSLYLMFRPCRWLRYNCNCCGLAISLCSSHTSVGGLDSRLTVLRLLVPSVSSIGVGCRYCHG